MAGKNEVFQTAMNKGHSAAWDQDWEAAANSYRAALKEFPSHPLALTSLGLALLELQDYQASLECYQKAAGISPADPIPQEKTARIFERLGRLNDAITASLQAAELHLKARSAEKAIDNWLRVLSIQPENITVRTRLAAVYDRLGRQEEAVAELISVASILQRANNTTQAASMLETAARMVPGNQEVRLAMNMVRSGRPLPRPNRPRGGTGPVHMAQIREMEGQAESDSSGQPDPIAQARQMAMVQLASLLFEQAGPAQTSATLRARGLSALTRGVADPTNDSSERNRITLHLSQAIDSLTQAENAQAVVELEYALNLGLRHPSAYFILGLLLAAEKPAKAGKYLEQSVRHPDYSLGSHLLFAQIYQQAQQWKEAATAYFQALALADVQVAPPDQSDEINAQYDALIDSQSVIEDTALLQDTCKTIAGQLVRPNWRDHLIRARQQLPAAADGMPPAPVAEMLMETRGGQVVDTMAQVRKLAASGRLRTALEEALYALQYAPTYLPLHILVGDLLHQDQRPAEAVRKYMVVVDLYTVRGEVTRSVRLLKRVLQIQPMNLQIRQHLIDLLLAQNKIEEALKEYSDMANLYYNLADLDKARQIYLDALKVAQKSQENRKWGLNLLLKVADIDMQRLNLRQALRIYEQIRTIQPHNQMTYAQIIGLNFRLGQEAAALKELDGYLHSLESAGRHKEGISFIDALLAEYSDRLELRLRLADLYVRDGQLPEAIAHFDAMADAHLNANRHPEAIRMIETIIALNPPNVQEYHQALETLRRSRLAR